MNTGLERLENMNPADLQTAQEFDFLAEAGLQGWTYDPQDGAVKLNVKFVNKSRNPNPTYQKEGDSGFDLTADIPEGETVEIAPLQRKLIKTGLFVQIPYGYELQVRSRSGLALKNGIMVLNSPGTVDAGYRGEVGVILYNTGDAPFTINNGDRIAQAVIAPVMTSSTILFSQVQQLDSSERGAGGFGSTGV